MAYLETSVHSNRQRRINIKMGVLLLQGTIQKLQYKLT